MKYAGRFFLLLLSALLSVTHVMLGQSLSLPFFIFTFIYLGFAWMIGRQYDKFRYLSYHDPLTGAYNRRYAYEKFAKRLRKGKGSHQNIGIINIDINHFKAINDTYGHECGDVVLQKVSDIIIQHIAKGDLLVRLGGDEFLIIYLNADKTLARERFDYLYQVIQKEMSHDKGMKNLGFSLSIGVSVYPEDGQTLFELVSVADQRMYTMKSTTKKVTT